jgi:hypothetical protein
VCTQAPRACLSSEVIVPAGRLSCCNAKPIPYCRLQSVSEKPITWRPGRSIWRAHLELGTGVEHRIVEIAGGKFANLHRDEYRIVAILCLLASEVLIQ